MTKLLFVGEERSELAKKLNVTWEDGKLAAKQLFDALDYCNINRKDCEFTNWFEGGKTKTRQHSGIVVAMGNKVSNALKKENINHIFIYHPAARGKIRKKERYLNHVKEQLSKTITL